MRSWFSGRPVYTVTAPGEELSAIAPYTRRSPRHQYDPRPGCCHLKQNSIPLIKWRRLDAQCPQINVPLPAVMHLVIDDVKQQVAGAPFVLTERLDGFLKAARRNL